MINSDLKNLSKCIFIILVILINILFSKNLYSSGDNEPRDRAFVVIENAKYCFINSNNKLFLKPYYDSMMEFLYEFSEVVGTYLDHAADSYLYNARIQAEFILDNENCL